MIQNQTQAATPHTARPSSDLLTILIFKDNYAARTFKVPLRWISQLGIALGAMVLACAISVGVAIRYYALSRLPTVKAPSAATAAPAPSAHPAGSGADATEGGRVMDLQKRISDLQAALELADQRGAPLHSKVTPDESSPNPPRIAPLEPGASGAGGLDMNELLFTGLPSVIKPPPADLSMIPIRLHVPKAVWHGNTLGVHLYIQYVGPPGGKQEGRIALLARGPSALLGYPGKILQATGSASLIDINRGEHFGVSRFREVQASFGPVPSRDWIGNIEVVVVSDSGQLLIHQRIDPSATPARYTGSAAPSPATLPTGRKRPATDPSATPDAPETTKAQEVQEAPETPETGKAPAAPTGTNEEQ